MKRFLAIAACGGYLVACGGGAGELVKLAEDYAKKVCDAKDQAEASKVMQEYGTKAAEAAKKAGKASEGDAKKIADASAKMSKCVQDIAAKAAGAAAGDAKK